MRNSFEPAFPEDVGHLKYSKQVIDKGLDVCAHQVLDVCAHQVQVQGYKRVKKVSKLGCFKELDGSLIAVTIKRFLRFRER